MFLKILIFCSILSLNLAQYNSPVLLWGTTSISKPILSTVTETEFTELLEPKLQNSMFLVFLENDLQPQDLTLCKTSDGKKCFVQLSEYEQKSFLSDVENPIDSLKSIANKKEYVTLDHNGNFLNNIQYEVGKIVFVNFPNKEDERSKILKEHDDMIKNIYDKISQNGKTIGLYVSKESSLGSSHSRVRRRTPKGDDYKVFNAEGFIMYYKKLRFVDKEKKITEIEIDSIQKKGDNPEKMFSIDLISQGTPFINFDIHLSNGYWNISNVKKGDDKINSTAIFVAEGFSYYCWENRFTNNEIWVEFEDLQMEANFSANAGRMTKFNDPWHCTGFTSSGIWMGLFVTFMFLFILSIGITWMMDINTMDRFDDPKGKTITITAAD